MSRIQRTFSPIDGTLFVERPLLDLPELLATAARARQAQARWRSVPLAERVALARAFVERFAAKKDEISTELTRQVGRP
ncbi:MAG TPA: aldehyde dehydrogenase family protein, partial [Polyangiaceae bacterium]|nr:aldehyde dehydrogenase family protein [Polyangiaceae bacterium]